MYIPSSNMGNFDLLGLKSVLVVSQQVTMECYYFFCQYFVYLETGSQVFFLLSRLFIKLRGPRPTSVVPSCHPYIDGKGCHPLALRKKAVTSSGKDEGTLVSQVIILTDRMSHFHVDF